MCDFLNLSLYACRYVYCPRCFSEITSDKVMVGDDPLTATVIAKNSFKEMKNNSIDKEPMVSCVHCGRRMHTICVLHMDQIYHGGFQCDDCLRRKGLSRKDNKFTAKRKWCSTRSLVFGIGRHICRCLFRRHRLVMVVRFECLRRVIVHMCRPLLLSDILYHPALCACEKYKYYNPLLILYVNSHCRTSHYQASYFPRGPDQWLPSKGECRTARRRTHHHSSGVFVGQDPGDENADEGEVW